MDLDTPCCRRKVRSLDLDSARYLVVSRVCPKCRAWYTVEGDRDKAGRDRAKWTHKGTAPRSS